MKGEIEFLVCKNCETPCYAFDIDRKGKISAAFCAVCGNDDLVEFQIPESDESGGDE